nr:MAG TPA_asm: hypothetical protein [Caudoviricetes sp.]
MREEVDTAMYRLFYLRKYIEISKVIVSQRRGYCDKD